MNDVETYLKVASFWAFCMLWWKMVVSDWIMGKINEANGGERFFQIKLSLGMPEEEIEGKSWVYLYYVLSRLYVLGYAYLACALAYNLYSS